MKTKETKRTAYYDQTYNQMLSEGRLTGTVLDPDFVLRSKMHLPGVYRWNILDIHTNAVCCAYIGETSDLYRRTKEHLKRWFYNSQTYHYLGIHSNEVGHRYVLILHVDIDPAGIAYSTPQRRKEAEISLITKEKPYTQYTEEPSEKINPKVKDSCIWHKYRRDAFLKNMR